MIERHIKRSDPEYDWRPHPTSTTWCRCRGDEWVRFIVDDDPLPPPPQRAGGRGNQDYSTHHLGRGTKWANKKK